MAETQSIYRQAFDADGAQQRPQMAGVAAPARASEAFEARGLPGPSAGELAQDAAGAAHERQATRGRRPWRGGRGVGPGVRRHRRRAAAGVRRRRLRRGAFGASGSPAQGLTVAPLAEFEGEGARRARVSTLAPGADIEAHPFAALNTAFFRDGACHPCGPRGGHRASPSSWST
ncbi:MAG: hypothetical protein U5L11_08925 [Arhodomonas sp.]|nr:hypothetical protein [Arhodomonas sp.]